MLERYYRWYGKNVVRGVLALLAILIAVALYFTFAGNNEVEEPEVKKANVSLRAVQDINFTSEFTSVGTVQAVSEASLQTEAGGRVTAVNTEIGKTVGAGTVIASIENSSERASVLQAEGAYEAAVAGAAQSNVGVNEAEIGVTAANNAAVNTFRTAYLDATSIITDSIDKLFTNPNSAVPGVKIGGTSLTSTLNQTRVELQSIMPDWQREADTLDAKDNLLAALSKARANTQKIADLVDTIIVVINDEDVSNTFTDAELTAFSVEFSGIRSQLNITLNSIANAETSIKSAKESLDRVELGGTSGVVSSANAQVKIALGSLRSAQSNLEKTLVRTPISGVVNALYLKAGDYVSPGQPAAIIANNNGLEIVTSVSEDDKDKLNIGQEVVIDKTSRGVITAIAGAVDPTTGKIAVKVSVEDNSELKNGSTVALEFSQTSQEDNSEIIVPLSAIKMTGSGPVAFKLGTDNRLESLPLTLGTIQGDSVVVSEGLALDTVIVLDARGLKAGEEVTVNN